MCGDGGELGTRKFELIQPGFFEGYGSRKILVFDRQLRSNSAKIQKTWDVPFRSLQCCLLVEHHNRQTFQSFRLLNLGGILLFRSSAYLLSGHNICGRLNSIQVWLFYKFENRHYWLGRISSTNGPPSRVLNSSLTTKFKQSFKFFVLVLHIKWH